MTKLLATSALFLLAQAAAAQDPYAALPGVESLPPNVVQVSPFVPMMGEHWADPATLPLGPIYCVHRGKVVCLEFMMAQADLKAGRSWPALAGMAGLPPVHHTHMGFVEHGHEGFEVPHYDVHMYFLPPEEVSRIQPDQP